MTITMTMLQYKKNKMTVTMTMTQHKMTKFRNDHSVTVVSEMTVPMTASLKLQ